ncbi:hypothetical protein MLD38_026116 [Melastoma candidum]|uniref:Uncharacterized protein n=1 Tax=Melastoma candidum TaxID=119954 RepID=A0ACB9P2Q3_9MYRT|nr:hypothetical protein MLD38_026116 [Melastoma candidum]
MVKMRSSWSGCRGSSPRHCGSLSHPCFSPTSKRIRSRRKKPKGDRVSKEELINPQEVKVLESRLADMTEEIEAVKEEMKRVHMTDMDSAKSIMMNLDHAARALQNVAHEEISYRNLIASLGKELENAKKERVWLEDQEREIESSVMHLQLQNSKSKINGDSDKRRCPSRSCRNQSRRRVSATSTSPLHQSDLVMRFGNGFLLLQIPPLRGLKIYAVVSNFPFEGKICYISS